MFDKFKNFFKKDVYVGKQYIMKQHTSWGNSIVWTNWPDMQVHGWLHNIPLEGDTLVAEFQSGKVLEFTFTKVRPCNDPRDMFFADVKFLKILQE